MLKTLSIRNYALITELDIHFERGFSVITGETGAGKSILLGAIGLLLGQRADSKMIKNGANRCTIEAEFDITGCQMDKFFSDNDLDFDGHSCILRRELTAAGKSRAFINDTPAQVSQLRELGNQLIDIHSQHQNLLLGQEDFQLNVVDILARNQEVIHEYKGCFEAYQQAQRALREAEETLSQSREDEDYWRFQLTQLDELQMLDGRQFEMENEAKVLEHAEEIREALWNAEQLLTGSDMSLVGALNTLREANRHISSISELLPQAENLAERIDSCYIELKDIAEELNAQAERIDVNPLRLVEIHEWLSALYSAMQKHHAKNELQLIDIAEDLRNKLALIDDSDEHLQALRQQCQTAEKAMLAQAKALTTSRQKAAEAVEEQMRKHLMPLGIPNVQFKVEIRPRTAPNATGLDQVRFLFCANKNGHMEDIADIASGGEIARVMLSLKALISDAVQQPTIIFDEIDTGVSGHIAERMAEMMRDMGANGRQVISITHLPQIAALGSRHYRVFKEDDDEGTSSHIERLTAEARVNEIAHMLSGSQLTPAAIENAKSLLSHNGKKN